MSSALEERLNALEAEVNKLKAIQEIQMLMGR